MSLKTLSQVETLLRVYWSPQAGIDLLSEQSSEKHWLLDENLICLSSEGYEVTERGRIYVEAIRDLPLPVQTWRMP